jgi:class I fructose-bisphosphate aldolase
MNNNDSLRKDPNPCSAVTSTIDDALRLGCTAVGFTIYPGTTHKNTQFEQIRELSQEAKAVGLPTVLWSYPRGQDLSKEGETGIDVVAYAAQIACQLGAHIVKVKPPTRHIEQDAARKVYEGTHIPIETLSERIQHVLQSSFGGRRIVIFSGGAAKGTEAVLAEVEELAKGGAFGSIMGRNAFQRPKAEAIALLQAVMDIFARHE